MKAEPSLVVQIRKANPCATLREIGEQVGVSYQRVQQILTREGLPTKRPYKHLCQNCGKRQGEASKMGLCRACKTRLWTFASLPCAECGATMRRKVSSITSNARHGGQGRVFCNRVCNGRWFGKTYGLRVHPGNRRLGLLTGAARRRKVAEAELCPPKEKEPQA